MISTAIVIKVNRIRSVEGLKLTSEIFISYRREDSQAFAGRLFDRLEQVFGREQVFIDVDAIEPGLDFAEVLNERLQSCKVVLAIIGSCWASSMDADGRQRLNNPDDFVRIELEIALARNIRVIPVLVGNTQMPPRTAMPESLGRMVMRQAIRLTHERFSNDVDGLISSLIKVVSPKSTRDHRTSETTQPSQQVEKGWSAKWLELPGLLGWSMTLSKGGREHKLEAAAKGYFLDGEKIGETQIAFNHLFRFKLDNEQFELTGKAGLFSVKWVKLSVGTQPLLEWKES